MRRGAAEAAQTLGCEDTLLTRRSFNPRAQPDADYLVEPSRELGCTPPPSLDNRRKSHRPGRRGSGLRCLSGQGNGSALLEPGNGS